jgi:ribosomal protein S18 acetylase RimI-like enzyme
VWHIAQIAVDPSVRRNGLARRLVQSVCESAGAAGAREVTLVVDDRNEAARALYASMGFRERATLLFGSRPRLTRVYAPEPALAASN